MRDEISEAVREAEPWLQEALIGIQPYTEDDIVSDAFANTCWSLDIDYSQPVEIRRSQFRALMEREWREKQEGRA